MKKSKIIGSVVAAALSLAACNATDTASRNISYELAYLINNSNKQAIILEMEGKE